MTQADIKSMHVHFLLDMTNVMNAYWTATVSCCTLHSIRNSYSYILTVQLAQVKKNPLQKVLYFSNGRTYLSQTFRLYVSANAVYPANFIDICYMIQQIQQFKL